VSWAFTHSYPHVVSKVSGVARKKRLFSSGHGASGNICAVRFEKAKSIEQVGNTYPLKSYPATYKKTFLYSVKPFDTV